MSLKHKTVHGLFWNFLDNFSKLGIGFITGIILARILTPREFGLIGMLTIFIALSQSIIDSGLSQALIRKKECTQADYSTVFFFNQGIGIVLYLILILLARPISNFYDEPILIQMIPIISISLITNGLGAIQSTILTKRLDFKLQTKISVITAIISGAIGITMAYTGYGVWSLVFRAVSGAIISVSLLWIWNTWRPSWVFSLQSLREMFSFGSKLLISGIIDTLYRNIYIIVIGKYFSATELGYFTRAQLFQRLPSENITRVIQRVSYPVLSSIRDDATRLKSGYQKLIKGTMFITFILMIGMAASAKPMVLTLVGEKWLPSVIYLQLLCFTGTLYPLQALNLNILNVTGRSDLYLKLEIYKKILAIPVISIGIYYGIAEMIIGMIAVSIIAYFLNSYYSGRLINYSSLAQIKDITLSFLLALANGIIIYLVGYFMQTTPLVIYITQILISIVFIIGISELFKIKDYLYLKDIVKDKVFKRN